MEQDRSNASASNINQNSLHDRHLLAYLQQSWNSLDVSEWAPIIQSKSLRKLYLHDLMSVRHGKRVYYSLGAGPQRQAFGEAFANLSSRRLQEGFLQHASMCLDENRFMSQGDLTAILHVGRGKRLHDNVASTATDVNSSDTVDNYSNQTHRDKRVKTNYDTIHCFA